MASEHPVFAPQSGAAHSPLMLLVPGHDDAPARRWLANWESRFPEAITVELGLWDRPHRNTWVNRLNLAIHRAGRPVVIVAEGLATMAVAWWAEYEQPGAGGPVRGALLIDPPDVDRPGGDARLASFPSCPRAALPFAACVLASRSRGPLALRTIRQLAADWGGPFDTLASAAVLAAPSLSPVQSLGQKVLSGWMSATA